jgi:hypothetical protein
MKQENIHQEILLLTSSVFSLRELCQNLNYDDSQRQLSATEKLAGACWSGLLHESMPEIIQKTKSGKSLYIWQIQHSSTSLQISLSSAIFSIEPELSIASHLFLNANSKN